MSSEAWKAHFIRSTAICPNYPMLAHLAEKKQNG